jgi:hypothetical protein
MLLVVLAGAAWVLWPLREASALPEPAWPHYAPQPPDEQQMLLIAPALLTPSSSEGRAQGTVRVIVYDPRRGEPAEGVRVRLWLAPPNHDARQPPVGTTHRGEKDGGLGRGALDAPLFVGTTDASGTVVAIVEAPLEASSGDWDLLAEVVGPLGEQRIVHRLAVAPQVRLSLASDRSRYRPGQTMHLVAHLRGAHSPGGQAVAFSVADPRGNLVCATEAATAGTGVAYADCPLAAQVHLGEYRIAASAAGQASARQSVRVEQSPQAAAHAPRVHLTAGEPFYAPGERVAVSLHATTSWGAPLDGARVEVSISLQGKPVMATLRGTTGARGAYSFTLDNELLPERAFHGGPHLLQLAATVTGREGAAGEATTWLPAAGQPILLYVDAESGTLVPGIENLLRVQAAYPDGRPAACTILARAPGLAEPLRAQTFLPGNSVASLSYLPPDQPAIPLTLLARDGEGREARAHVALPVEPGPARLLLRTDRASYASGETVRVEAWAVGIPPLWPEGTLPAVYLDLEGEGEVGGGWSAPLEGHTPLAQGPAVFEIPLPRGFPPGTLTLRAHLLAGPGISPSAREILVSDTRQVQVGPEDGLRVEVRSDRSAYAPGDKAAFAVRVLDAEGEGEQSVLSVALLPHDAVPATFGPAGAGGADRLEPAFDIARSDVLSRPHPVPALVQRQFESVAALRRVRREALSAATARVVWALLGLAVLAWVAVLALAVRTRGEGRALRDWDRGTLAGLLLLPLALGSALPLALAGHALFGPGAAIVLGIAWLGLWLSLLILVDRRRDAWTALLWAATSGALALIAGLGHALGQGATLRAGQGAGLWLSPLVLMLAGLMGLVLAHYFAGVTLARGGERRGAAALWGAALALLVTLAGLASAPAAAAAWAVREVDAAAALEKAARFPETEATGTPGTSQLPVPAEPPAAHPGEVAPPAVRWAPGKQRIENGSLFPQPGAETVFWLPAAITDARGQTTLQVPLPRRGMEGQSAWRLAVQAVGKGGRSGHAQLPLKVSQPLWIEASLPGALTVGDELDLPVRVYNALPISQSITLTAAGAPWYNLRVRGSDVQTLTVPGHDVGSVVLPLRVREWGRQQLELAAQGEQGQDARALEVEIAPDGWRTSRAYDGWLERAVETPAGPEPQDAGQEPEVTHWKFRVPWSAIRGTDQITVSLYTGPQDVFVEAQAALDPLAPSPSLGGLLAAHRARWLGREPEPGEAQQVYQQLLAHEAPEGGFGARPGAPPDLYHTAEALAALRELAAWVPRAGEGVAGEGDQDDILDRSAAWLWSVQSAQGTWLAAGPATWERLPRPELPTTAFVAWSLIEAGYADAPQVRLAVEHLARYLDQAQDPYVLALIANALLAYDERTGIAAETAAAIPAAQAALERLGERVELDSGWEGDLAYWAGEIETWAGSSGEAAAVQRTALAVLALLRGDHDPDLAERGVRWLGSQRGAAGHWDASGAPDAAQANWLALRALHLAGLQGEAPHVAARVYVAVDEIEAPPATMRGEGSRGPVQLAFETLSKGYNDIALSIDGQGKVPYRIVGTYVLPWREWAPAAPEEESVSLALAYDRTTVRAGEWITASVTVTPSRALVTPNLAGVVTEEPRVVPALALELGLPPGLHVEEGDWQTLIEEGIVDEYRRDGQMMLVSLANLPADEAYRFTYRLRALYPLSVQTPPSRAYAPADPAHARVHPPLQIDVHD